MIIWPAPGSVTKASSVGKILPTFFSLGISDTCSVVVVSSYCVEQMERNVSDV